MWTPHVSQGIVQYQNTPPICRQSSLNTCSSLLRHMHPCYLLPLFKVSLPSIPPSPISNILNMSLYFLFPTPDEYRFLVEKTWKGIRGRVRTRFPCWEQKDGEERGNVDGNPTTGLQLWSGVVGNIFTGCTFRKSSISPIVPGSPGTAVLSGLCQCRWLID